MYLENATLAITPPALPGEPPLLRRLQLGVPQGISLPAHFFCQNTITFCFVSLLFLYTVSPLQSPLLIYCLCACSKSTSPRVVSNFSAVSEYLEVMLVLSKSSRFPSGIPVLIQQNPSLPKQEQTNHWFNLFWYDQNNFGPSRFLIGGFWLWCRFKKNLY